MEIATRLIRRRCCYKANDREVDVEEVASILGDVEKMVDTGISRGEGGCCDEEMTDGGGDYLGATV